MRSRIGQPCSSIGFGITVHVSQHLGRRRALSPADRHQRRLGLVPRVERRSGPRELPVQRVHERRGESVCHAESREPTVIVHDIEGALAVRSVDCGERPRHVVGLVQRALDLVGVSLVEQASPHARSMSTRARRTESPRCHAAPVPPSRRSRPTPRLRTPSVEPRSMAGRASPRAGPARRGRHLRAAACDSVRVRTARGGVCGRRGFGNGWRRAHAPALLVGAAEGCGKTGLDTTSLVSMGAHGSLIEHVAADHHNMKSKSRVGSLSLWWSERHVGHS